MTHWLLCRVLSCSPVVTVPSRGAGGEGSMPGGLGSETRNLCNTALSASLKDASEDDMRMMRNKELCSPELGSIEHTTRRMRPPFVNFSSGPKKSNLSLCKVLLSYLIIAKTITCQ